MKPEMAVVGICEWRRKETTRSVTCKTLFCLCVVKFVTYTAFWDTKLCGPVTSHTFFACTRWRTEDVAR